MSEAVSGRSIGAPCATHREVVTRQKDPGIRTGRGITPEAPRHASNSVLNGLLGNVLRVSYLRIGQASCQ